MAHRFAKLMMEGKLKAASHLIGDNAKNFPLALNSDVFVVGAESSVRDVLLGKHPQSHLPVTIYLSVLVCPSTTSFAPPFHSVLFDRLDGSLIHRTILLMNSVARPSSMDITSWRKLCTSFWGTPDSLLAAVARRLVTTFVDLVVFLPLLLATSLPWINTLE